MTHSASPWPISLDNVLAARRRIAPHLPVTPVREYPSLDAAVGAGVHLIVKHENLQPTKSFKARNGLSFMTALSPADRARGVVAASTGNHGLGIAFGGRLVGADVTICVPERCTEEKASAMRELGARLVVQGRDYDESVQVMKRIAAEQGRVIAHSTNDPHIIAGAGTMTLEILEQAPDVDALVLAIGGGSQAVGAMTVLRRLAPRVEVFGVQAAGASAAHDSWHARRPVTTPEVRTFADGVATRSTYELTFPALLTGLTGFVAVTDAQIAAAIRLIARETDTIVEGAGALGLAGTLLLRDRLAGKRVGIAFCGANIGTDTLRRVMAAEI